MENLQSFKEFVSGQKNREEESLKNRGIVRPDMNTYAIQVIVTIPKDEELLLEYEKYVKFKNSTKLYSYHPENRSIPVKAHYHVKSDKGTKELYAVNLDGRAHHKRNRGYCVSSKEASELRALGVLIPTNNIIESEDWNKGNSPFVVLFFIVTES